MGVLALQRPLAQPRPLRTLFAFWFLMNFVTVNEIQRRRVDHGYFYHIVNSPIAGNRQKMVETEWAVGAPRVFLAWPKCVTVSKNVSAAAQHVEKNMGNFRFPMRHVQCIKVCIAEATGPRLGSRINLCTLSCTPLREADRTLRINTPGGTESISLLQNLFLHHKASFFIAELAKIKKRTRKVCECCDWRRKNVPKVCD